MVPNISADHFNVSSEDVDWGHAGTLADYAEGLKQITDHAFSESEFARSRMVKKLKLLERCQRNVRMSPRSAT